MPCLCMSYTYTYGGTSYKMELGYANGCESVAGHIPNRALENTHKNRDTATLSKVKTVGGQYSFSITY